MIVPLPPPAPRIDVSTGEPTPSNRWAWWLGFTVVYVISATLSLWLTEDSTREASFWLPSGLFLGALLISARRDWPGLVLGVLVGDFVYNAFGAQWPFFYWLLVTAGNIATGLLGAWWVQRMTGPRLQLTRVGELVHLVGWGGVGAQVLSALIGAWVIRQLGSPAPYWSGFRSWYGSDLLGVILLAPLIIVWRDWLVGARRWRWRWHPRLGEFLLLNAGLVGCIVAVAAFDWGSGPGLRYVVFPFVVWAAVRTGPPGLTVTSLGVALLLGWLALQGFGVTLSPLQTPHERNAQLQLALSFIGFFGLIPAIAIEAHTRILAELQAQQSLQKAIFDHDPECVKVFGLDGRILEVNPAGLALLEVADAAEARAFGELNFVAEAFREDFQTVMLEALAGRAGQLVFQIHGARGSPRWLEMAATPLADGNGTLSGVLAVSRDITARRKTEEALQWARFTVDHSTVPMIWNDQEAMVVDANPAACALLGYTLEELRALSVADIDLEFDPARWPLNWVELREKQSLAFESRQRRKDGTVIDVVVRTHFQSVGGREFSCAFVQDVTAQKQSEAIQRKREEELRLVFSAVGEGIVVQNQRLEILQCNPAAERILGLTQDEMSGRTSLDPRWRAVRENGETFPGGDHPASVVVRTARSVRNVIMGVHKPDASLTWISINAEPLCDSSGAVTMVVCSFQDITQARTLQDHVRQAQKMEVFGQLAGGVAHDFNNLLTAMMLNLHLIDLGPTPPTEFKQPLEELGAMARRGAKLTSQLLLFARRSVINKEAVDLGDVVANVLILLRRVLGEVIVVEFERGPDPQPIEADAGMIDQVVMNLCVNARDAMPTGGKLAIATGLVRLEADPARLPERVGRFAYLRVRDNGCGMSVEVKEHIFEPFYTTKEVGKGTGLGLATVHGIVQEHGGWIEMESEVGCGSTFCIYLPLAEAGVSTPADAGPGASDTPRGDATILLVEDEEPVRMVASLMLRRQGFKVIEATNGPEAVRLWDRHQAEISVLLSDMVMPQGMDGLTLGRRFRAEKPGLGVIIMSGYTDEILARETLQGGQVIFLSKPFEFDALVDAVLRACG